MKRRTFMAGLAGTLGLACRAGRFDAAADVLARAVADGRLRAAALSVRHGKETFDRAFGAARSPEAIFLLASITKTMTAAALMTRFDRGEFRLDDPASKFIPEFAEGPRKAVTLLQLFTHTSGLPDQLPENEALRRRHAPLGDFVQAAVRTPLLFEPGARCSYSSMGILLLADVARRITGKAIAALMDEAVFRPLEMSRSALGLGRFVLEDFVPNQTEQAAPESGAGDPAAKEWDWNSPYWRMLGAPWGTAHASAPDVARFFLDFLHPTGRIMKAETSRLMVRNHNRDGLVPRGLGFASGPGRTFGHTGSSGTLAWADPETDTVCVVLTTLPARAASPHPRNQAADLVAKAIR